MGKFGGFTLGKLCFILFFKMRVVSMPLLVTENVQGFAVSPLDKDDELVFLNNIGEYEVLIRSASDPPFGICKVFVYKRTIKVGMVKNN